MLHSFSKPLYILFFLPRPLSLSIPNRTPLGSLIGILPLGYILPGHLRFSKPISPTSILKLKSPLIVKIHKTSLALHFPATISPVFASSHSFFYNCKIFFSHYFKKSKISSLLSAVGSFQSCYLTSV